MKKIKIILEKKLILEEILFLDDEVARTSEIASGALQAPVKLEQAAKDAESAYGEIIGQSVDTRDQMLSKDIKTCSDKIGTKAIVYPAIGGLALPLLVKVSAWANDGSAKIKGPLEWAKEWKVWSKKNNVEQIKVLVDNLDINLEKELKSLNQDINSRTNMTKGKAAGLKRTFRGDRGRSLVTGSLWLNLAVLVPLGVMNVFDAGDVPDDWWFPARQILEIMSVYEWAIKFAALQPLVFGQMDGMTDPCLLYAVVSAAAGFAVVHRIARRGAAAKKADDVAMAEKRIAIEVSEEIGSLAERVRAQLKKVDDAFLNANPNIPKEAKEFYQDWLKGKGRTKDPEIPGLERSSGQAFASENVKLSSKLEEIYKNKNGSSPTQEQIEEFRDWAVDYHNALAKSTEDIINPYVSKAQTFRDQMNARGNQVLEFLKNKLAIAQKFPELSKKLKLPSRKKKDLDGEDLTGSPEAVEQTIQDFKGTGGIGKGISGDAADIIREVKTFEEFLIKLERQDPADVFLISQQRSRQLKDLLDETITSASDKDLLLKALLEINSNQNLQGKILTDIAKDLKISPKVFRGDRLDTGLGKTGIEVRSADIGDKITDHLIGRFYGGATPAQRKALIEFCENIGKQAERKGLSGAKIALVGMAALGVVGYASVDKKVTAGDYYFTGDNAIGRGISELLNSFFGKRVVLQANKIHFQWAEGLSDPELKLKIRKVLDGGIFLKKGSKSVEDIVNDDPKADLPRDREGNLQLKGLFDELVKSPMEYNDADQIIQEYVGIKRRAVIKFSEKDQIKKSIPGIVNEDVVSYMVLLYVNGSNLKSRLESYIKKQENGRMPRSRRIRELQKTFEFNRSDVVSVLRQIRRLEDLEPEFKKVVKPAVQPEEVPDAPQDLEINTERRPGQIDEVQEIKNLNLKELKEIVSQMINENTGQGYMDYPYHSETGHPDEEAADFVQDWKNFELSLVRDKSRETAIRVAKILVKDLELFGDVIDLVGKNQSVATEILNSMKDVE